MKHQLYKVYFELYGKKMKTTAIARSEKEAHEWIKNRIIFHKTELQEGNEFTDKMTGFLDELDNIMNIKPKP